jgi:Ca-activated chloride channel homolog
LSTVGVGNSFDAELMRGLAERGAGNFYFAEDAKAVSEVFTQELDYFIEPLALDVKLEANAKTGYEIGEAVGVNYWQHDAIGRYGRIKLPAVFLASRTSDLPGQGRRGGGGAVFLHLIDTGVPRPADGSAATVTLSYRMPNSQTIVTQTIEVAPPAPKDATLDGFYTSDDSMKEAAPMYHMFRGLRYATHLAKSSPDCALAMLLELRSKADAFIAKNPDYDLSADLVLVDKFISNLRNLRALPAEGAQLLACTRNSCVDNECDCDVNQCKDTVTDITLPVDEGTYPRDYAYNNACSAGNANTLAPVLLVAMVLPLLGRRRRI